MATIDELYARKSCRAFTEEPLTDREKEMILQASLQAPTAGNMALYEMIEIRDPKIKSLLAKRCDDQPFIAKAPFVVLYVASYQKWYDLCQGYGIAIPALGEADLILAIEDTMIAAQNAVVAAWSMGIGSCYIGDILENYEANRELFGLPQYAMPVSLVVFGRPTKAMTQRPKPARFELKDMVSVDTYAKRDFQTTEKMVAKVHPEVETFVRGLASRKLQAAFHQEMNRSVKKMLSVWLEGEKTK